MKKQLLLFLLFFLSVAAINAQRTVTGVVTSADDGMPVIGASVLVKGTTQGTITDIDGNYSINASENSVLVFSFVGLESQEVRVGTQNTINVTLLSSSIMVEEVVVTAMGVRAEKKKLNYATQSLDTEEVTAGQSANFVNSLQGKIAGLQTSNTGGSPNATSQLIIRAPSSINTGQSNEPMFIVDGMPIIGGGNAAGDINPNDIESLTVLKGAAASALYGQDAANGVIMITTKSGKAGKVVVNANASWQIDNAVRIPEIQQMYGPGSQGFYRVNTLGGWGPLIQQGEQIYNNVDNFLGTGFYHKYDVSASGGTDKFTGYISANYSNHEGVAPKDYKNRLGVLLKGSYEVSKWIKISLSANVMESKSREFSEDDMKQAYRWPINDDMRNYKNADGSVRWLYDQSLLNDTQKAGITSLLNTNPMNPYWGRYEDWKETQYTRNIIMGSIDWNPVKNLVFAGKVSYEKKYTVKDSYETPRFKESDFEDPSNVLPARFGQYVFEPNRSQQLTAQAVGTYNFSVTRDFDVNLLAGVELKDMKGFEATMGGANFILPGDFYSIQNVGDITTDNSYDYGMRLYHYKQNKFGYFGELRVDYRGIAHASVTGRWDMSSTLNQKSYFYPSVTAGVIFSELFKISNSTFSYGKLRGNWAKVGKDGPRYKFDRNFKNWSGFPDGGFGVDATVGSSNNLLPEMTKSWEVGLDLRFFDSRTKIDAAYYSTTVDNQIVTVRVSPASGMILQTRNEGAIENYGVEIQVNQDILYGGDFRWTAGLNFGLNRGKVVSLPDEIIEVTGGQYGDIYATAYLNGSTTAISGKDYNRTSDGQIICDENGYPEINPAKSLLIGNREPDFLLGLSSTFSWKDLSISFLIDGRKGGDVVNVTSRSLFTNGQHKSLEKYRNREIIVDGVVLQADGTYAKNTKPIILNQTNLSNYFDVSSNFIEDGSYIRLSYVTVGYDFTRYIKNLSWLSGLKASITGRNLFLLTKYTGSDPQIGDGSASGPGSFGIDNYGIPNTRSFNFSINATF